MRVFLLLSVLALSSVFVSPSHAVNSPLAKQLIRQLKPQGLSKKAEPSSFAKLEKQAITVLEAVHASARSNGPKPRGLLEQSFELQPNVGHVQRAVVISNIVRMWEQAVQMGLFDDEGKFHKAVTRGMHTGKQVKFDYAVPLSRVPRLSKDLSNIHMFVEGSTPPSDGILTQRQLAFATQLDSIIHEIEEMTEQRAFDKGPRVEVVETNAVGQTEEEHLAKWKAEAEAAGAAMFEIPELTLGGRLLSSPSKRNDYKWGYGVEIFNLSHHPTEVEVVCTLIGVTDIKREHYRMAERKEKLKLRSTERVSIEAWTAPEKFYKPPADDLDGLSAKDKRRKKTKVSYRGTLVEVLHGSDRVLVWSSDPTLAQYLDKDSDRGLASKLPDFSPPPVKKKG